MSGREAYLEADISKSSQRWSRSKDANAARAFVDELNAAPFFFFFFFPSLLFFSSLPSTPSYPLEPPPTMGPLSLPVELVSHIIRLNAAVPLSEGASPSSSRSAELHSFCLVSTVWYATAVPELYKHLALPTPLSAWLLNAATLASWDILARVEGAKSISVGEPPQARLGEGKWWMAESPVVVADAFLQLFAKVRGVEIMCVSGLKELEIRDLSQFSGECTPHPQRARSTG